MANAKSAKSKKSSASQADKGQTTSRKQESAPPLPNDWRRRFESIGRGAKDVV